jgi:hypothetical protein
MAGHIFTAIRIGIALPGGRPSLIRGLSCGFRGKRELTVVGIVPLGVSRRFGRRPRDEGIMAGSDW